MHAHLPDDKLATIADSLFAARKIEAIKMYRDLTGLGLKEAKDAVEEIEGALRRDFPEKFTRPSPRAGCLGTAALFALCLCGVTGWLLLA